MHYQYRRMHIAAAYARQWRAADLAELPLFLKMVNESLRRWDDVNHNPLWQIPCKPRRGEIMLQGEKRDYRAKLLPGVDPWRKPFEPLTSADVAAFEYRATA